MVESVKVEGLKELLVGLRELPNATAKNVMKRVLMKAGEPIAEAMRKAVPVDHGDLRDSITVGTKLSPRQRSKHRKQGDDVEVFIGPGPHPQAHMVEFGTVNIKPQPYVRPAWDAERMNALDGIKADLWTEIERAAARIARKTAKLKG